MSLRKSHSPESDKEAFFIGTLLSERLLNALKPSVQIDNVWDRQEAYENQSGCKVR